MSHSPLNFNILDLNSYLIIKFNVISLEKTQHISKDLKDHRKMDVCVEKEKWTCYGQQNYIRQ
jgi:hypothetical protein